MTKALMDCRVLVARPDIGGEDLCKAIAAEDGFAVHFPSIAFAPPADEAQFLQMVQAMGDQAWIIFNSPQSVRATIPAMRKAWPYFPETTRFAAVGAGTARTLKEAGYIVNVIPEREWSSEGLMAMPEFQDVAGQKVMVVRGEGGREYLERVLNERQAVVSSCLAYQRVVPEVADNICASVLQDNKINAIAAGSFATVNNLKLLLGQHDWPHLSTIPILVMSERVKKLAAELGFQTIWVTEQASNDAAIATLKQKKEEICRTSKNK